MPSPASIKEVQMLMGRPVVLNRFLSNYASKSFPFVKTLKNVLKKSQFPWTPEAETAFQEMKTCLAQLPTLTTPLPVTFVLLVSFVIIVFIDSYLCNSKFEINGSI